MPINTVSFSGRLAKDPTLTQTGETKRCFFTLIQNQFQGHDEKGARRPDKVISVGFTIFNQRAQFLVDNFFKGDQLFIQAHIDTWQKEKDGNTEYMTSFIVDEIEPGSPSDKRRAKLQAARAAREANNQSGQPGQSGGNSGFDDMDDDLPF